MVLKRVYMFEKFIECPYCRQKISLLLDLGVSGNTQIIDDCEVCCRPIEINYTVENGEIESFFYSSIEGNEF